MQATREIKKLKRSQSEFPEALREIPNPPLELYVAGSLPSSQPVAMVGSRRASQYGRRVAARLASQLAVAGVPLVSGLAFGIDAVSHQAALEAGGQSMAVLPSGLNTEVISPRTNLGLAKEILEKGALLSEYPPTVEARKEHYVARNRLISGLAQVVVIVEAALPSGSLITAGHAAEQGKDVWAVPGPIDSQTSAGTNYLISQGAAPLTTVEEFLETIGVIKQATSTHNPILDALGDQPVHIDALTAELSIPAAETEAKLTKLELRGLVRQLGGRYYVRA